ncbi:protein of unknown function [Flavobacterium glycines]|jgi:hypothetical protein|uniref:DUF4834 domain-containing protein n=1 Tax=Flavobacterium glycines TaxID=551990 RepID=A0A1B9DTU8_9FLAO|nr:DUF4834 family protein [Flavobacterium glycines]OCB73112.1 hypothetical protein FBGL_03475 [Flavobacterium glycines]GEL12349.1 hypothetical protein FGL01_30880 [Flavobacterium glycines]SDK07694.1 protein of unknown function [Flavobacterium glycines]
MQLASFTGFFRTLFIIISFYYIFRFLAKLFLPVVIKKVVEKASENMQQQQQGQYYNNWQRPADGETSIYNTDNARKSRETKKVGDYVDYEEID